MRTLTSYADSFIVLTGRSDRQVRSIADAVVDALKSHGEPPLGVEGLDDGKVLGVDGEFDGKALGLVLGRAVGPDGDTVGAGVGGSHMHCISCPSSG